jgi:hypothetical protein
MLSWNQSFKSTMIVSFMGSFLRTTAMQLAGYRDQDLTFWQQWWAWGIAAIVAEAIFLVARRVLHPPRSGSIDGSENVTVVEKIVDRVRDSKIEQSV